MTNVEIAWKPQGARGCWVPVLAPASEKGIGPEAAFLTARTEMKHRASTGPTGCQKWKGRAEGNLRTWKGTPLLLTTCCSLPWLLNPDDATKQGSRTK